VAEGPSRSSLPIADMGGGAFAAIAILAALREGQGACLDLSLFESAFFWAAMRQSLDPDVDPRAHIFPVNDVFETRDGKRLTLGILGGAFLAELRAARAGARGGALLHRRFAPPAWRRPVRNARTIMKQRTAAEWLRLCEENDVPVDLAVTPGEASRHPQLLERQALERGYAKFPVWANGRPWRRDPPPHARARRALARDPGRARLRRRRDRRLPQERNRGSALMVLRSS
jgi:crotonobetainyl-CoA:carnitine CoA-transferase CaiB-like acyl-CoA transferase